MTLYSKNTKRNTNVLCSLYVCAGENCRSENLRAELQRRQFEMSSQEVISAQNEMEGSLLHWDRRGESNSS